MVLLVCTELWPLLRCASSSSWTHEGLVMLSYLGTPVVSWMRSAAVVELSVIVGFGSIVCSLSFLFELTTSFLSS